MNSCVMCVIETNCLTRQAPAPAQVRIAMLHRWQPDLTFLTKLTFSIRRLSKFAPLEAILAGLNRLNPQQQQQSEPK